MAFARASTLAFASTAILWASSCWSTSELSFGSTTGDAGNDHRNAICVPGFVGTMQIPTDFFVLQDKSESMLCSAAAPSCTSIVVGDTTPPTRWDAVVEAMGTFVNAAEGKGMGIGFFDQPTDAAESCNAADYAMPVVPIAPGNGQRISSAVAAIRPSGGDAILPALLGSFQYARSYALGAPGRNAAVVLVTDGYSSDVCPGDSLEELNRAVEEALVGTPPVRTYVVGIGGVANLDSMAHAGVGVSMGMACPWSPAGTTECYFNTNRDVTARSQAAMKAIAGMMTCDYAIPRGANPKLVNIEITLGRSGMPAQLGKVDNAAACGMPGGWYYDNPMTPTQFMLCAQSCGLLETTPNSTVSLFYGCPSTPPPQ